MQSTKSSILGISLGTRMIGVAIMCEGELVEWKVITFKEKWTSSKPDEIIQTLIKILKGYNIKTVSMKKVCPLRASINFIKLEQSFKGWCILKELELQEYTIEQLKSYKENTQQLLVDELEFEQHQQLEINTPYYAKVFEAVLLVQMGNDASNIEYAKKSH
jgi:hypothetical protein